MWIIKFGIKIASGHDSSQWRTAFSAAYFINVSASLRSCLQWNQSLQLISGWIWMHLHFYEWYTPGFLINPEAIYTHPTLHLLSLAHQDDTKLRDANSTSSLFKTLSLADNIYTNTWASVLNKLKNVTAKLNVTSASEESTTRIRMRKKLHTVLLIAGIFISLQFFGLPYFPQVCLK